MSEWTSSTYLGARPRSAVTVSLPAPALARLTRSVRAGGSGKSELWSRHRGFGSTSSVDLPPILGFTDDVTSMSDIPDTPGTSSSRGLQEEVPAHFSPGAGHGSPVHTPVENGSRNLYFPEKEEKLMEVGCHEV